VVAGHIMRTLPEDKMNKLDEYLGLSLSLGPVAASGECVVNMSEVLPKRVPSRTKAR
jgi:hypothetical protein